MNIHRSFANLLPRIGAQNAIPRWIMRDSSGPARWLLSGLLAAPHGLQKAGNSNEKDNRGRPLSSVDVFGSDG
jgi:hypothetical protein